MGTLFRFLILMSLKGIARLFYRFRSEWVGEPPAAPWGEYRVLTILNHTSLLEWLWIGLVPPRFVWYVASNAFVPVADKTLNRPYVGTFFKMLAPHVIPITREADRTWKAVVDQADGPYMIVILPEGRMKRADGLDQYGEPMTVRGGIADILQAIPTGRMLVAYSGGLHHVQVPNQVLPRFFQTLSMSLEEIDIPTYKRQLDAETEPEEFKRRVKADLEDRRDRYCPIGRELWTQ
jgi:1-acyl-sn-glycerol-3-phosphate acyltransferase